MIKKIFTKLSIILPKIFVLIPVVVFIIFGITFYFTKEFNLFSEFKKNARAIDIIEYSIEVFPDISDNSISVQTQVKISALSSVNTIYFLVGNMNIAHVRFNNKDLHFIKAGEILKIALNENVSQGQTIELFFDSHSHFDSILREDGMVDSIISPDYSIVRYQSGWYPRIPNDEANAKLIIHSLKDRKVVANGKLLVQDEKSIESVYTYTYPHDNKFSFIIDEYEVDVKIHDTLTLELGYGLQNIAKVGEISVYVTDIINFYRDILGKYPFDNLKIALIKEIYPGDHSCPNMIMIHETFLQAPHDEIIFFLAREIAFQWFGNFIKTDEFNNPFYVGALSEYLALIYSQVKEPKEVFYKRLQTMRNLFFYHKEFDQSFDEPLRSTHNTHLMLSKGVYIFHMLKYLLGDTNFYALLHKITEGNQKEFLNRRMLLKIIYDITQKDYSWFFKEWEDRAGAPIFDWKYSIEQEKKGENTMLLLKVIQDPVYETPVPIRIISDTTTLDKDIAMTKPEEEFRFEVPGSVQEVQIDPSMTIFRESNEREFAVHEEEKLKPIRNALYRVIELGTVNPIEAFLDTNSPFWEELYFNLNLLAHLKAKQFGIKKSLVLYRDKEGKNLEVILGIATNSNHINETVTLHLVNYFGSWKVYRMKYETL